MTVSIHQPNFIPWIGYFYKIYSSDIFVILDDVQYTKNGFTNRNKIRTSNGMGWLTVPIVSSFGQNINKVKIHDKEFNIKKIIKSIEQNYNKSSYFDNYFKDISYILNVSGENLCKINIDLIKYIVDVLKIDTEILISSELKNINGKSTDRLVSICKNVGATSYFSGFGGMKYQEENMYNKNNIDLVYTDFNHPIYEQRWKNEFIPNMSIIDLLFNNGPFSLDVIMSYNENMTVLSKKNNFTHEKK
jgi:hypothetical protein